VYENGVLRATGSTGTTTYTTAPQDVNFAIGNTPGTSEISFKGTVDEVRWAPVALSDDRIRADYETVANADFFVASPPPGFIVIVR
ncbi:MAG: hypothetical protein IKC14_05030, partial [Kiritimatiellae bacterium]|nr:hypothetical protein [Kiritimatiellia bacterium]